MFSLDSVMERKFFGHHAKSAALLVLFTDIKAAAVARALRRAISFAALVVS